MASEGKESASKKPVIGALKVILSSNITTEIQNLVALDDYPKQEVTFTVSVRISGNIGVTCERFERLGMEFVKKNLTICYDCLAGAGPSPKHYLSLVMWLEVLFGVLFNGKMKGIAFIKDPDGYWKTIGKITETAA
ncbi:hypothetical protein NC652_012093 [Populus alba x Populus x berolinensis]|nr:hypothetical protein NC652_012093 [Populus alba x Populus x berolinensis]